MVLARFGVDVALGLDQYPSLARLLRYTTHKELAVKIVQRVLEQQQQQGGADQAGTSSSGEAAGGAAASAAAAGPGVSVISSVDKVRMLFKFIAPLVADPESPGEAGGAAELDDEVRRLGSWRLGGMDWGLGLAVSRPRAARGVWTQAVTLRRGA